MQFSRGRPRYLRGLPLARSQPARPNGCDGLADRGPFPIMHDPSCLWSLGKAAFEHGPARSGTLQRSSTVLRTAMAVLLGRARTYVLSLECGAATFGAFQRAQAHGLLHLARSQTAEPNGYGDLAFWILSKMACISLPLVPGQGCYWAAEPVPGSFQAIVASSSTAGRPVIVGALHLLQSRVVGTTLDGTDRGRTAVLTVGGARRQGAGLQHCSHASRPRRCVTVRVRAHLHFAPFTVGPVTHRGGRSPVVPGCFTGARDCNSAVPLTGPSPAWSDHVGFLRRLL